MIRSILILVLCCLFCQLAAQADDDRKSPAKKARPLARFHMKNSACVRWRKSSDITPTTKLFTDSKCKNQETNTEEKRRRASTSPAAKEANTEKKRRQASMSPAAKEANTEKKRRQASMSPAAKVTKREKKRRQASMSRAAKPSSTLSKTTRKSQVFEACLKHCTNESRTYCRKYESLASCEKKHDKSSCRELKHKGVTWPEINTNWKFISKTTLRNKKTSTIKHRYTVVDTCIGVRTCLTCSPEDAKPLLQNRPRDVYSTTSPRIAPRIGLPGTTSRTKNLVPRAVKSTTHKPGATNTLLKKQVYLFCVKGMTYNPKEYCFTSTKQDCDSYPPGMCKITNNKTEVDERTRDQSEWKLLYFIGEKKGKYQLVNDCSGTTSCFICDHSSTYHCLQRYHPDYEADYMEEMSPKPRSTSKPKSTKKFPVACISDSFDDILLCFAVNNKDCDQKYGKNYCKRYNENEADELTRIHLGNDIFKSWQLIGQPQEGMRYETVDTCVNMHHCVLSQPSSVKTAMKRLNRKPVEAYSLDDFLKKLPSNIPPSKD